MSNDTHDGYMYDRGVETMSRDQLSQVQLEKLKANVAHASANVSYYQKSFAAAGVTPEDLQTFEDFEKFPFTVKRDLRDKYPFGMFAVPREDVVRIHASSGTTGKPTVVGYTQGDLDTWTEVMARTLACAGVRPGDLVHNAYGYGLFTGGLGAHYGAEKLGCSVVPVSGGFTERQIALMQDFGARVLCATPSYALNIAEVAERSGVDIKNGPLEIAICGAEPWTDEMRSELDERLGIRAIDIYGLSEIIGPGVAAECYENRHGLHIWEDLFYVETIDPETGAVLRNGELGEMVITTLSKWAQPMIRYRTRDITRIDRAPCSCGRNFARIMRITGRNDDMLIIRGVNLYPSHVEAVLLGRERIEPHYQLIVHREGTMDTLSVDVEASPGVVEDDFGAIAKDVKDALKTHVGVTCNIKVKRPGAVPRSEGKAVRVVDRRPKD